MINLPSQLPGQSDRTPRSPMQTKKIVLIAVLSLCLLLVGSGSYYFLAVKNTKDPAPQSEIFLTAQKDVSPTPLPPQTTSQDTLPDQLPAPTLADSQWKQYRTSVYVMNYPPSWKFDYYAVANGVKIYNPASLSPGASSSATLAPSQYVILTTQLSNLSAITYADTIQFACCLNPSAPPEKNAAFQKQTLIIGNKSGVAYTPLDGSARKWDIVLSSGKHLIIVGSSILTPEGTLVENQMINSIIFVE